MCDDWALRASVERSTARELIACRVATPWPWQRDVVEGCIKRARAEGLRVPKPLTVCWRERPARALICAGAVSCERGRNPVLYLAVDVGPQQLARTVFHELQHVSDYLSHPFEVLMPFKARVEMEARAEFFADKMIGNLW